MITFNDIWKLLYDHGAGARKEEGTRTYWSTLTPQQQQQVFTTINEKLQKDLFVHYDPVRAIKENLRRYKPAATPTNYNGASNIDEMLRTHKMVTATYNGTGGIFTLEDAQTFQLPNVKPFNF